MIREAGLGDADLIAASLFDYEKRAIELATKPNVFQALKTRVESIRKKVVVFFQTVTTCSICLLC